MRLTFGERVEAAKRKTARRERELEKKDQKPGLLKWLSRLRDRFRGTKRRCSQCNKKEPRDWVLQCVSCGARIAP